MNKRVALTLYLGLWTGLSIGVIFGMTRFGYPLWAAAICAYLLFMFLNGALAYLHRSRQLKREGEEAPAYLRYLCIPRGFPKYTQEAPASTHALVGLAAAVAGLFFAFCGVALALDANWSQLQHPFIVIAICSTLAGIGAAFLYLAWRLFAHIFRR